MWILAATAVLAVVAIGAAIIAVSSVRSLRAVQPSPEPAAEPPRPAALAVRDQPNATAPVARDAALEPQVVEGRLIVPPTQRQVVATALGRPGVRLSVLIHGVSHAMRAESRDRITALMRREYRRRRRARLQAGRRAVRAAQPTAPGDEWLGS
ncbi:hypothetical protein [Aeromicrobium sp. UC242_57]|uniref:hypothetical protein n=1 Tax=Aeromicrobium sp. UC242_57 TaxID=3374624 RepID=UPI00379573DE